MPKPIIRALLILLTVAITASNCPADEIKDEITLESLPPSVVKTVPQGGDTNVDSELSEISVTFSRDMKVTGHCWSWCSEREDLFPKLNGKTEYLGDNRTCVLHVALEPEKTYAIWINTDQFQSFQDTKGHPSVPYLLVFSTGSSK